VLSAVTDALLVCVSEAADQSYTARAFAGSGPASPAFHLTTDGQQWAARSSPVLAPRSGVFTLVASIAESAPAERVRRDSSAMRVGPLS